MTLLILAAGLGTRFSGGIKQLSTVGKNGETLMEFSCLDAARAGFDRAVFVIRRDIEKQFRELADRRIGEFMETNYCFQDASVLPAGFDAQGRTKPWGTTQAILAARELIDDPFVMINADDYYGISAYNSIFEFLSGDRDPSKQCMAGFKLRNTLSRYGKVTRGICRSDENNMLLGVSETYRIADEDGVIMGDTPEGRMALDGDSLVSMNMFGFDPSAMGLLEEKFAHFLERAQADGSYQTAEYPVPVAVDELIREGRITMSVLPTHDKWYGMTVHEDLPGIQAAFAEMMEQDIY